MSRIKIENIENWQLHELGGKELQIVSGGRFGAQHINDGASRVCSGPVVGIPRVRTTDQRVEFSLLVERA